MDPHELPATARKILRAARRIIVRKGFAGLTLQAVEDESGCNEALVGYYFGNKAGLIAAVFDALAVEQNRELARRATNAADKDGHVHAMIAAQEHLTRRRSDLLLFSEVLPHMLRERRLRERLARLYRDYRALDVRLLEDDRRNVDHEELELLAALAIAVFDGLSIQRHADPGGFDAEGAYALWERMVERQLAAPGITEGDEALDPHTAESEAGEKAADDR